MVDALGSVPGGLRVVGVRLPSCRLAPRGLAAHASGVQLPATPSFWPGPGVCRNIPLWLESGRRARLSGGWPSGREGSTPSSGTATREWLELVDAPGSKLGGPRGRAGSTPASRMTYTSRCPSGQGGDCKSLHVGSSPTRELKCPRRTNTGWSAAWPDCKSGASREGFDSLVRHAGPLETLDIGVVSPVANRGGRRRRRSARSTRAVSFPLIDVEPGGRPPGSKRRRRRLLRARLPPRDNHWRCVNRWSSDRASNAKGAYRHGASTAAATRESSHGPGPCVKT